MPGINLSRIEAIERSKHVSVESYDVFLDLTATGDTFIAKSTVKFACTSPGYDTFIDAVATRIDSATLNGKSIDTSDFDGESIFLKNLEADIMEYLPGLMKMDPKKRSIKIRSLIRAYDPCISCATH